MTSLPVVTMDTEQNTNIHSGIGRVVDGRNTHSIIPTFIHDPIRRYRTYNGARKPRANSQGRIEVKLPLIWLYCFDVHLINTSNLINWTDYQTIIIRRRTPTNADERNCASASEMGNRKPSKLKQNMANSIFPIHLLGRFIGIVPYSLNPIENERKPATSKRDLFYVFAYFISYMLMGVYTIRALYKNDKDFEIIPKFAITILIVALIALVFLYIILCLVFRTFIMNSYKRIDFLDENFKSIQLNVDYVKSRKFSKKKCIVIAVSSLVRTLLMIKIMHLDLIQQLTLLGATFVKSVAKNHFMILVLEVRDRYRKINDRIKTMFVPKTQAFQQDTNDHVNYVMKMLYILCRIHYKLRKVIQSIITAYSVHLLFYLGTALCSIIFQSYFLYVIITIGDFKKTIFFFGSTLSWLLDEIYELYTLVDACASACNTVSIMRYYW